MNQATPQQRFDRRFYNAVTCILNIALAFDLVIVYSHI